MRSLKGLHRLSLLLVLAGLVTIYGSTLVFSPESVDIDDIGNADIGSSVEVAGTVRDLSKKDDVVFFDLEGEKASIRSVYFGSYLGVEEGEEYTFQGRIEIYQGELELVVDKVASGGNSLT